MNTEMKRIKLTLGPVLFHWDLDRLWAFYCKVAEETTIDRVHVGEVICGRRSQYQRPLLSKIIDMLEVAGKEVVFSDLAMPGRHPLDEESDLLCPRCDLVEINSLARLDRHAAKAIVIGPFLDVYNEESARFLVRLGAQTICLPVTLPRASVRAIATACAMSEIEVFAFGRVPRVLSAVCHHARLHGREEQTCRLVCGRDPDGLVVSFTDRATPFVVNGCQVLSQGIRAYCPSVAELRAFGISRLRISPHTTDIVAVCRIYRRLLDELLEPADAARQLSDLSLPGGICDEYLQGQLDYVEFTI